MQGPGFVQQFGSAGVRVFGHRVDRPRSIFMRSTFRAAAALQPPGDRIFLKGVNQ
jgi:hypothetical protein